MSTISHGAGTDAPGSRRWDVRALVPEMWASLAIGVMWLAVAASAIWGSNIATWSNDGSHANIPSAVIVAVFAWLGTHAVARYGFRREN